MTEVEVTDYETVEKTETKYQCDHCDAIVAEDQINTSTLIEGTPSSTARLGDTSVQVSHVCETCSGVRAAIEAEERYDALKARWEGITEAGTRFAHWSLYALTTTLGVYATLTAGIINNTDDATPALIVGEVGLGWVLAACCLGVWTILTLMILDTQP